MHYILSEFVVNAFKHDSIFPPLYPLTRVFDANKKIEWRGIMAPRCFLGIRKLESRTLSKIPKEANG